MVACCCLEENFGQPYSWNSDGQVEGPYFSSSYDFEDATALGSPYFDSAAYLVVLLMC